MQEQEYGYCECGCGQKTDLAPHTVPATGREKGKPIRFINGHQSRQPGPKYEVDENGCWIWLRYVNYKGYGMVRPHGSKTMKYAHRVYYEEKYGPVPEGAQLDHICHTNDPDCAGGPTCQHRRCVNPDHLEPVTPLENSQRGRAPGPKVGYHKPRLTHCQHGHEFTPENTHIDKSGARRCRECMRRRLREYYYRRKARERAED